MSLNDLQSQVALGEDSRRQFKHPSMAVWFFQTGQRIVVVRCFVKKSRKTPPGELELARRRMAEYLNRNWQE